MVIYPQRSEPSGIITRTAPQRWYTPYTRSDGWNFSARGCPAKRYRIRIEVFIIYPLTLYSRCGGVFLPVGGGGRAWDEVRSQHNG